MADNAAKNLSDVKAIIFDYGDVLCRGPRPMTLKAAREFWASALIRSANSGGAIVICTIAEICPRKRIGENSRKMPARPWTLHNCRACVSGT